MKYIEGVRATTNRSKDGKFPLLGCSGMKGIGKTAMLVHGARRLVPGLGQDVKAFYLTFNGGGARKKNFLASLRRPGGEREYDDAFGHMLMACCGVERDVAQHLGFDDCLSFCRSLLGLDGEAGTVVFFVDEIGDLEDKCTPTLSALMSQMDQQHGKLAFFFRAHPAGSAERPADLLGPRGDSLAVARTAHRHLEEPPPRLGQAGSDAPGPPSAPLGLLRAPAGIGGWPSCCA